MAAVFLVILTLLNLKLPLYLGMLGGTAATMLLFGIGIADFGGVALQSVTSWGTLEIVIALYVISLLQAALERRFHLQHAQSAMNGLFRDQRMNVALASIFIGMMPAPSAVTICGKMVDDMAGEHLSPAEKACCASYYRHVTEGVLPTFPVIVMACSLSGVSEAAFFVAMLPMVAVLIGLGFLFYLRKVPLEEKSAGSGASKRENLRLLLRSLWTMLAAILIIVVLGLPAWLAVLIVVVINVFVDRFTLRELKGILVEAFNWQIIVATFFIFIFKDTLLFTGIFTRLPDYFAKLPIPIYITMALLFFFGTVVAGSNAVGATFTPLAFSMIPGGGVSLLVLLMGFVYSASQISPTHICVAIAAEYFNVSLGTLIGKILPMIATYCLIIVGYYQILRLFL